MATTIADSGFYGIVDFSTASKEIVGIGYDPGVTIFSPASQIVVQPPDSQIYKYDGNQRATDEDGNDIQERTPFEAFLQTLYGAGASLTSESVFHDLDTVMVEAGVSDQYSGIEIVDFMAFTGAVDRFQTMPDGSQVDLLSLGPDDTRPNVNAITSEGDLSLMYEVIDHLGIQGMYPYLYSREGINFKEFCDRLRIWKEEAEERQEYVYQTLIPILRTEKSPVLTESQVLSLIKE